MRIITSLAAVCLCLLASACSTAWEPQYGPVPQTAAANQGNTVRVVMKGGAAVELKDMRVVGDSIVGQIGTTPQRHSVATADVEVISVGKVKGQSDFATTVLTAGAVTIVGIIASAWLFWKVIDDI